MCLSTCEHVAERQTRATHTAGHVHYSDQTSQLFLDILDTASRSWSPGRALQIHISSDHAAMPYIPHFCLLLFLNIPVTVVYELH